MQQVNIFWFRRDLRLFDNVGLFNALKGGLPVVPVFIFDTNILDQLPAKADARVAFIHESLTRIQQRLIKIESSLHVFRGTPRNAFEKILDQYNVRKVYTNSDYEPYAISRDQEIAGVLKDKGVEFHSYKDHVIFEKNEVMRDNQRPYLVFTPYSRQWKKQLIDGNVTQLPSEKYFSNFYKHEPIAVPSLKELGFETSGRTFPSATVDIQVLRNYGETRNLPAIEGTSRLGVHLRFGTISIRQLVAVAQKENESFLSELIWREFFQMILFHFPKVATGKAFKPEFEMMPWRNNTAEFQRWCEGRTGYPIVDAGMRQLNETGFMHNRVRMITASFLNKHLLIDWRWGEAYFAEKLLDYELASNNGNWQWVAGSGVDAAPYFRIFNPILQAKKFDPANEYIKRWIPEWNTADYPTPIVEHELARKRALEAYKKMRQESPQAGTLF